MELRLDFESVKDVKIGIARGILKEEDLETAVTTLWDAVEGSDLRILWDLTEAHFDVEVADIRKFADFARANEPEGARIRTGIVVSNDLEYGLVRMFEGWRGTETSKVAVFRQREQALEWLRD